MTTNYDAGRRMEYQACEDLRKLGYQAQRTAGSHSPFDIIAWDSHRIALIQVKRTNYHCHIAYALRQARQAWQDVPIPQLPALTRLVWVRYDAHWYKLNLAPKPDERTGK